MSKNRSYERSLRAFVAEARIGRIGRVVTGVHEGTTWGKSHRGRLWINGDVMGEPNPRFAHLYRNHD